MIMVDRVPLYSVLVMMVPFLKRSWIIRIAFPIVVLIVAYFSQPQLGHLGYRKSEVHVLAVKGVA
jgi:hypothetical protein